jgi:hypothetical protein
VSVENHTHVISSPGRCTPDILEYGRSRCEICLGRLVLKGAATNLRESVMRVRPRSAVNRSVYRKIVRGTQPPDFLHDYFILLCSDAYLVPHAEAQLTLILQRPGCQIFGGTRFGCIRKVRMNQDGKT